MRNDTDATLAFRELGPEQVLQTITALGFDCDGRLLALNSFENRVYQVGLEDAAPVIAKFYRPQRWSDAQILEEHLFAWELFDAEIDVVPPLRDHNGETLHHFGPFRVALFERRGGRPPQLDNPDHLEQLGRFLGRLHNVGRVKEFVQRPALTIADFGECSYQYVLENGFVPADLELAYRTLAEDLLPRVHACFERAGDVPVLRLHGDCHAGNILWTDDGPHMVDLDDARNGPAVQDLWMFLSGDRRERTECLHDLLDGYTQFAEFDARELHLVEALRTLRLMHYYAWLARRWEDPAFPHAFPWFNSQRCWEDHILTLREQAALMDEPPLEWS